MLHARLAGGRRGRAHRGRAAPQNDRARAVRNASAGVHHPAKAGWRGRLSGVNAEKTAPLQSQAPAKPGACVSPEWASYRQASQEALKKSAACITCPAARKRAPFIQDYLSGNRKAVHLFPLRSVLEAKAFLLSPALLGGISRKHTKQRAALKEAARFHLFCIIRLPGAAPGTSRHGLLAAHKHGVIAHSRAGAIACHLVEQWL